jgi:hypothetical protein
MKAPRGKGQIGGDRLRYPQSGYESFEAGSADILLGILQLGGKTLHLTASTV